MGQTDTNIADTGRDAGPAVIPSIAHTRHGRVPERIYVLAMVQVGALLLLLEAVRVGLG